MTDKEKLDKIRLFCETKEDDCRAVEEGRMVSKWKRESYARRRTCYTRVLKELDRLDRLK